VPAYYREGKRVISKGRDQWGGDTCEIENTAKTWGRGGGGVGSGVKKGGGGKTNVEIKMTIPTSMSQEP